MGKSQPAEPDGMVMYGQEVAKDDRKFGYKDLLGQLNTKSKHSKLGVLFVCLFL